MSIVREKTVSTDRARERCLLALRLAQSKSVSRSLSGTNYAELNKMRRRGVRTTKVVAAPPPSELLTFSYPVQGSGELQQFFGASPEFAELRVGPNEYTEDDLIHWFGGDFYPHQVFAARFVELNPRLLIMDRTGTGKFYAALAMAEMARAAAEQYAARQTGALLRPPRPVASHLARNFFSMDRVFYVVASSVLLEEILQNIKRATRQRVNRNHPDRIDRFFYNVFMLQTFISNVVGVAQNRRFLTHALILFDEAHNLRSLKNLDELRALLDEHPQLRCVELTASPSYHKPKDAELLLNLLLPPARRIEVSAETRTISGSTAMLDHISYMREAYSSIRPHYVGDYEIPDVGLTVAASFMQYEVVGRGRGGPGIVRGQAYTYYKLLRLLSTAGERGGRAFYTPDGHISDFVFPDGSFGKGGFERYVRYEHGTFSIRSGENGNELRRVLSDVERLRLFSARNAQIVEATDASEGLSYIVMEYRNSAVMLALSYEGRGYARFALEEKDVIRADGSLLVAPALRYAFIERQTTLSVRRGIFSLFTHPANATGAYLKALIMTPVSNEGINLYNIETVHSTPRWVWQEQYQMESRGYRGGVHKELLRTWKGKEPFRVRIVRHAAVMRLGRTEEELFDAQYQREQEEGRLSEFAQQLKEAGTQAEMDDHGELPDELVEEEIAMASEEELAEQTSQRTVARKGKGKGKTARGKTAAKHRETAKKPAKRGGQVEDSFGELLLVKEIPSYSSNGRIIPGYRDYSVDVYKYKKALREQEPNNWMQSEMRGASVSCQLFDARNRDTDDPALQYKCALPQDPSVATRNHAPSVYAAKLADRITQYLRQLSSPFVHIHQLAVRMTSGELVDALPRLQEALELLETRNEPIIDALGVARFIRQEGELIVLVQPHEQADFAVGATLYYEQTTLVTADIPLAEFARGVTPVYHLAVTSVAALMKLKKPQFREVLENAIAIRELGTGDAATQELAKELVEAAKMAIRRDVGYTQVERLERIIESDAWTTETIEAEIPSGPAGLTPIPGRTVLYHLGEASPKGYKLRFKDFRSFLLQKKGPSKKGSEKKSSKIQLRFFEQGRWRNATPAEGLVYLYRAIKEFQDKKSRLLWHRWYLVRDSLQKSTQAVWGIPPFYTFLYSNTRMLKTGLAVTNIQNDPFKEVIYTLDPPFLHEAITATIASGEVPPNGNFGKYITLRFPPSLDDEFAFIEGVMRLVASRGAEYPTASQDRVRKAATLIARTEAAYLWTEEEAEEIEEVSELVSLPSSWKDVKEHLADFWSDETEAPVRDSFLMLHARGRIQNVLYAAFLLGNADEVFAEFRSSMSARYPPAVRSALAVRYTAYWAFLSSRKKTDIAAIIQNYFDGTRNDGVVWEGHPELVINI